MATSPFLWGSGGAKLTPEEIALQRSVLARRKAQGVDVSPIASPLQGLARVVDALGDRYQEGQLNASAADNAKVNQDILTSLLGGGSTASSMPTNGVAKELSAASPAATSPTVNIGASQEEFISSLLPVAIEESKRTGVDPRIIVGQAALETGWGKSAPGNNYFGIKSHGQAGGNQLATTEVINGKPVRITDSFRAYQSPAESVRGYGDFILQNPRYEGLRTAQGLDGQLEALQASGYATDPNYGNKVGSIARAIQLPSDGDLSALPVRNVGQAPVVASPQVAQTQNIAPTNALGVSPAIIQALTSPYANDQTKGVAKLLLQQQQQKQEAAQAQDVWLQRQRYEQEMQNADPLRQLQIQKAQIDVNSANQPQRQPLLNLGNGTVYDPNAPEDKRFIQSPNSGQNTPESVRALEIRAERAGLKPGTQEYNQFMLSGGGGGTSLSVGPNGEVSFQQGGAYKPTEGQSKDAFFSTRLQSATPTIDQYEQSLLSLPEAAAGAVPFNLGRYAQSKEYQLAKDAGDDFVAAYLRKDSGAALTKEEKSEYGNLLLPQPGDKSEVVEAKRRRRQVAIAAINSGLPVAGVDSVLKALGSVPGATVAAGKGEPSQKRLKFNQATGELE